jgi:hypothetical protein
MIRRRLIRGICIALLTLCVTAWVGSYWQYVGVSRFSDRYIYTAYFQCGEFTLISVYHGMGQRSPQWDWGCDAANWKSVTGRLKTSHFGTLQNQPVV